MKTHETSSQTYYIAIYGTSLRVSTLSIEWAYEFYAGIILSVIDIQNRGEECEHN